MGFANYAVEATASFESALDEAVRYYLDQAGPADPFWSEVNMARLAAAAARMDAAGGTVRELANDDVLSD